MSGAGSGGSGRPAVTAPMSERQQMALLMQMTSNSSSNDAEMSPGSTTGSAHSRTSRDRINERGETALHIASKKGDQDAVKKLLEQGANPNVTDFAGNFRWLVVRDRSTWLVSNQNIRLLELRHTLGELGWNCNSHRTQPRTTGKTFQRKRRFIGKQRHKLRLLFMSSIFF